MDGPAGGGGDGGLGHPDWSARGLGAEPFVESQLFGLSPTDPFTLLMAAIALSAVALSAGYIPARRATRVGPMLAIRDL